MQSHWYVLGVGAVGGLFARRLLKAGAKVTLIAKDSYQPPSCTIQYRSATVNEVIYFDQCHSNNLTHIDHLLVTTKAYDVEKAIDGVSARISSDTVVVILANGMGYHDCLINKYPWLQLIAATTSAGCFRSAKDVLVPSGSGKTYLGHYPRQKKAEKTTSNDITSKSGLSVPRWFHIWGHGMEDTHWTSNIDLILIEKLLINSTINPLTATRNISNGDLLQSPYYADFQEAIEEVAAVLRAAGYLDIAGKAKELAEGVALATASNTSSMRADVNAQRRTEIQFILGYLLEDMKSSVPREIQPSTPVLDSLFAGIKDIENKYSQS